MHAAVSGTPLAATNEKSAGAICKRRVAVRLGRQEALQRRERCGPAVHCCQQLGGAMWMSGVAALRISGIRWTQTRLVIINNKRAGP